MAVVGVLLCHLVAGKNIVRYYRPAGFDFAKIIYMTLGFQEFYNEDVWLGFDEKKPVWESDE